MPQTVEQCLSLFNGQYRLVDFPSTTRKFAS